MRRPALALIALSLLVSPIAWSLHGMSLWVVHLVGYGVAAALTLWLLRDDGELAAAMTPRPGDVSYGSLVSLALFIGAYFFATQVLAPSALLRVCTARGAWVGPPNATGARAVLERLRDDACVAFARSASAQGALRAALVLAIASLEEIAWRGGVQHRLADRLGSTRAWLVASALYAIAHLATGRVSLALLALPAGLAWGALFRVRGSLVAPIVSHAIFSYFFMVQRVPFVVRG